MIDLRDFIAARLNETAPAANQEKAGFPKHECFRDETWQYWASGHRVRVVSHCGCSTPEAAGARRAIREAAAKRRVLERHTPTKVATTVYCDGCPTDQDGFPGTELNDCPELQDLAYIWNDHEDWNQAWCPHVEGRHETDVPELPPARAAYTNTCNRCGAGDGWHYRKDRTA